MRLRISPDGTIRGLWDDQVNWPSLGRVPVRRAPHLEFDDRRPLWYVRTARTRTASRMTLQWLLLRRWGEMLFWSKTRAAALGKLGSSP